MSLAKLLGTARKPPRIITLGPDAFADTFEDKPRAEVAVGLRLLAERDLDIARGEAARRIADRFVDKDGNVTDEQARDEAYNDALIRWAVARATCNPNDVSQPYFEMAEDVIGVALTGETIRTLWDELVLLHKGKGAVAPPATDAEVAEVAAMLSRGALSKLAESNETELRKLLAYVHTVLRVTDGDHG